MQTSFSTLSFATFYQSNKQLLASPSTRKQHQQPPLDRRALFYMFLLAVQFGVQPILTRRYTPPGITRSTVVLMQEFVKFAIAGSMLQLSGATREALKGACTGRRVLLDLPRLVLGCSYLALRLKSLALALTLLPPRCSLSRSLARSQAGAFRRGCRWPSYPRPCTACRT
jgi:hypothetical protein